MAELPTGTVTFLFTDIEGSTRLLRKLGDRYAQILADQRLLLRAAFQSLGGHEVSAEGDAFFVAFPRAKDAVEAAVAAQKAIASHPWPEGAEVRVRMGLHTGEPLSTDLGYIGLDVHQAARICSAGHGGQILISGTTHALVAKGLPDGVGVRDLGEHRLKDLAYLQRLFQVVAADLRTDFPPIRSLDLLPNNLPRQLTSFVGREREMAEVKRLLSAAHLVTLTGSGGAGKTRLALQVAADVVDGYPDGVWLAEFAPIADPVLVPKTVASGLGVPEQPGREMTETLIDYLRPKALLLVLDNCEHLLASCARLADVLLQACSKLRILATSREGFGIAGETLYPVPTLPVPNPERLPSMEDLVRYDAVQLFAERATAVLPTFRVAPQNAKSVAQVCHHLDGIPLAIELAAARVKVLTADQIVARLSDRFRLLTGGSRTALPRHQTLQAAMDWSYELLSDRERTLLRRISVFSGGFIVEAAEHVCAANSCDGSDILDLLTHLVDKSLVIFEESGGKARYRVLESIRQYGRARLQASGEADEVCRRHADFFVAFAEDAAPRLRGTQDLEWLDRLETEHDNLRAALAWSTDNGQFGATFRLVGALGYFWYRRGHLTEGRNWAHRALETEADVPPGVRLKTWQAAARLALFQEDLDQAAALGSEALAQARRLRDKKEVGESLYFLGRTMLNKGDLHQADAMLDEATKLAREVGDQWTTGSALRFHAFVALYRGNPDRARALAAESLDLCRRMGLKRGMGWTSLTLGSIAFHQRDYAEAAVFFHEGLDLFEETHDQEGKGSALIALGNSARVTGEHDKAVTLLQNALGMFQKTGALAIPIGATIQCLGAASASQGNLRRGARLFAAAVALRKSKERYYGHVDFNQHTVIDVVRDALGEAEFADAWAAGEAMTLEQAIEYALETEPA